MVMMIVGLVRISISQNACFSYNHMHNTKIVPVNIDDKCINYGFNYVDMCHLHL